VDLILLRGRKRVDGRSDNIEKKKLVNAGLHPPMTSAISTFIHDIDPLKNMFPNKVLHV
jgi:hypothetical protein